MRSAPWIAGLAVLVALAAAAPATAQGTGAYADCGPVGDASLVQAARTGCDVARAVASVVTAAPPASTAAALVAAGFTPVRALEAPSAGGPAHDVVAIRGAAAVRIRRAGAAPDLDGVAAGRELIFSARRIVGGRPVPRDAAICTSAFPIRLRDGSRGTLSAAHCAGLRRSDRRVRRHNAAMRRPPQPGIVLGRVRRSLTRTTTLDALVLPVPGGRPATPVVDRGIGRPPWAVAGPARAQAGRAVCFSGRSSGVDRCGRILLRAARGLERTISRQAGLTVRCTTIPARQGDSGGPVYTAPRADGTVRAVGIVTLVLGLTSTMCFTPLTPVLDRLGAEVLTASGRP
jgi:hypothetical protein